MEPTNRTNGVAQNFWSEVLDPRAPALDDIRERRERARSASRKLVRVRGTVRRAS